MTMRPQPALMKSLPTLVALCLGSLTLGSLAPITAFGEPKNTFEDIPTVDVPNPGRLDPLGPSERNLGKVIAEQDAFVQQVKAQANLSPKPRGRRNLENLQFLYTVEHTEDPEADPSLRRADVYYYDYTKNEAVKLVVDLKTNKVVESSKAKGAANQPYFTKVEIATALQLIFEHPVLGPKLQSTYQSLTNRVLTGVNQLSGEGGTYFVDPSSPLGQQASVCAEDRCMQLFLPIDDRSYIDLRSLTVDLTTSTVIWVEPGVTGQQF